MPRRPRSPKVRPRPQPPGCPAKLPKDLKQLWHGYRPPHLHQHDVTERYIDAENPRDE